jgi:hypothetical protein
VRSQLRTPSSAAWNSCSAATESVQSRREESICKLSRRRIVFLFHACALDTHETASDAAEQFAAWADGSDNAGG